MKAAGALIYSITTDRYLFLLRADDTYSNTWGLVGGKAEANESMVETLHREIKEELGTDIPIKKISPLDLFYSDDDRFEYHTFICVVENEFLPRLNHEHKGWCWTSLDGIPKPIHPALYNSLKTGILREKIKTVQYIWQHHVSESAI